MAGGGDDHGGLGHGGTSGPGGPGGTGGSGGGSLAALGLTVQVVTSGGPNRVQISGPTGTLAQLTRGQLMSALATGNFSVLGPQLLTVLQANGVSPQLFTQQLASLLK